MGRFWLIGPEESNGQIEAVGIYIERAETDPANDEAPDSKHAATSRPPIPCRLMLGST